jgi:hypothetical protein
MTETLSREQELVAYFVNHCDDGQLGRTRLMKLLYLADYEARRYLGRPISSIPYVWHHYGPYDSRLNDWTSELESRDVLVEERVIYPSGKAGYVYHRGPRMVTPSFTPAESEILAYVCKEYSRIELKGLLEDVVYETEPMVDAKDRNGRGEPLNMALVDNAKREEFGLPFEELLERSRRVRAGEYLPHAEAMMLVSGELAACA